MSKREIAVLLVFGLTYILIATRKLRLLPIGRPAGALLGALGMVVIGAITMRAAFASVDWTLLVFFCGLFVVVGALQQTGLVGRVWQLANPYLRLDNAAGVDRFSSLMLFGSNVVSNVPMVLLAGPHMQEFGNPQLGWLLLAYITNVAGNFTLLGSVANIIVAESARDHYTLGFFEYLKFGLVSTILVLATGVPLLVWLWG